MNPYGVAVVLQSTGKLIEGHILVSNFNNSSNLQGTRATIVQIGPGRGIQCIRFNKRENIAGCLPGRGWINYSTLVLRTGWVIVGVLPTSDGTAATANAGCLLVLNKSGTVVETFAGSVNRVAIKDPWDMTALVLRPPRNCFAPTFSTEE